jgi:aryl-alcohol dehydrogenase-like predicted oxidoreductase
MQPHSLGHVPVSPMGMGCWAIGGPFWDAQGGPLGWGEVDDDESVRAIHAGLAAGITLIDTADVYGTGRSERVIARALKGRRASVILATKFGHTYDEATRRVTGNSADAEYLRRACDASLARLETDHVDLLQFHWSDCPAQKADCVRETLEALVKEGKVRAYGWSTDDPRRADVFARGEHCVAVQFEYNLLNENSAMVDFCEAHDLASINRGPLAMGLLSGRYGDPAQLGDSDIRRHAPGWLKYFKDGVPVPALVRRMEAVRDLLTSGGRSTVQGALAWIWAKSANNIPIPGFRTAAQVEHNAAAMELGPLTPTQIEEIDDLLTAHEPG